MMTDHPDHADDAVVPRVTDDEAVSGVDGDDLAGDRQEPPTGGPRRWRSLLLGLAIARYVIPIAAIPLVPIWFPERMVPLTLVRPGKEILLAAGGVYRTNGNGDPDLLLLFLAFLPLMLFSVWGFFWLGRAWQDELEQGEGPSWLSRAVPPQDFARLQRLLEDKGPAFAFLGRVAALPPTIMAAAAGTSNVDTRSYLVADFLGAIASFATTVWIGWWLGEAYERGGTWFLVVAVVGVFLLMSWGTAWLRREPEPEPDA